MACDHKELNVWSHIHVDVSIYFYVCTHTMYTFVADMCVAVTNERP
jgi:hypothetical protein